jgi:ABC-type Fe2+-enterobactin transport system substrate-binding protein
MGFTYRYRAPYETHKIHERASAKMIKQLSGQGTSKMREGLAVSAYGFTLLIRWEDQIWKKLETQLANGSTAGSFP